MSSINSFVELTIQDFLTNVYSASPNRLIFWDSSALLEIIRFPYRGGDIHSYRALNRINGLIQANNIYSIASSITITEWNDHEDNIKSEVQSSLEKTHNYHSNCIQIANEIYGTSLPSETIQDKGLVESFEALADSIIGRTYFIRTQEIADSALDRVRLKRPPSKKKPEYKDCAIWETALKLSRDILPIDAVNHQVFYTVNTEDFLDKSNLPLAFHAVLLSEASSSRLHCTYRVEDANHNL